jgi:hypothetical protein
MDNGSYHGWHSHFFQAIFEPVDSPRLSRLVKDAELAISERLQELRVSANGSQEREAIAEAFASLRYLRDEGIVHSIAAKNGAARAS